MSAAGAPMISLHHDLAALLADVIAVNARAVEIIARIEASNRPAVAGNEAAGFNSRSLAEDRCDDGSNPSAAADIGAVADRGGARRPDGGERPATTSETGTHRAGPLKPAPFPARSSAKTSLDSDVGAAPAVTDKRPPQPIPPATANETGECAPRSVGDDVEPAGSASDLVKPSAASDGGYSVDPEAQKDSVDRTGRRNRGVLLGEASADAEPGRNPGQSSEVEPAPTKGEQVLHLWATTDLSQAMIAERIGCASNSVSAFVSIARKAGDRRADARVGPKPAVDASPAPTAEPPPPLPAATKAEPAAAPVSAVRPLSPPPASHHILSFAEGGLKVIGPSGVWTAQAGLVRMLASMNDGAIHSIDDLTRVGGYSSPAVLSARLGYIGEKLEDIGIKLSHIRGQGCKVERARP